MYSLQLFQDSDFAGDLEDSKYSSGGTLCIFGSHTFVPISWMCKKQTSVSHSSTESEIISLGAGLRLNGIPALDLWDLIVAVLHGSTYQSNQEQRDPCTNQREVRAVPHTIHNRKQSQRVINDLDNVDFISSNVQFFASRSFVVYLWRQRSSDQDEYKWDMVPEPTEMLLIGFSKESIWTPKSKSNSLTPKKQIADILTKGNFTRDEWNHLLYLFHISHFSSIKCSEVMSKRTQKDSGEERVIAKSTPMMNLVSRCSERNPTVLASTASESPGKTRHESQLPLSSWNEQHQRTGRPVLDACSSNYSEWNIGDKWSSQEWKSDELMEVRTGRPVYEQPPGLFTEHTDKFIVDDNDVDSDIHAESVVSLLSRSFLHRVNDRCERFKTNPQKMQHKTATNILWYGECLCVRHWKHLYSGKNYLDIFTFHQNYRKRSHNETDARYLKRW